jgi:tRNA dimethylallyltransferase
LGERDAFAMTPEARPLTPVLVGPTAVGKTAVAVALSEHVPLTIISADARQVYRRLDIGTAKPDAVVRTRVPHHGLDLVTPGERYSAGQFARDAAGWLTAARAAGRLPLVVGGTGFYVRAGVELARWAVRLDPQFSGGGRQRAARVIEVALLTGRPLSLWQRMARATGVMRPWYIVLTLPRESLRRRIAERVDAMLAGGLVEEVRSELALGTAPDAPGLDAVGYREVVAMLEGRLPVSDLREAITRATRRYAKRQETWFRHQLRRQPSAVNALPEDVWTLDASQPAAELAGHIAARWRTLSLATPQTRH